jgi:hypothetical protein
MIELFEPHISYSGRSRVFCQNPVYLGKHNR